jgi:hypothetical protein
MRASPRPPRCESFFVVRRATAIYRADASAALGVNKARVAAATSFWRIKLSPTRNEEMPDLASRAISPGVNIPLSPTTT